MEQRKKTHGGERGFTAGLCLNLIYGYQEAGRPIKATLCLIVGLGYTLAFATFTTGHLNILTIARAILIELAIDYGVHHLAIRRELRRGRTEHDALVKAIVYTGKGSLRGLYDCQGFSGNAFTNFKGIRKWESSAGRSAGLPSQ
jgi:predicted RND superfamily exporter protein